VNRNEARAASRTVTGHHDLCFGCGLANVFGLHLEIERFEHGRLIARFFVKQDHQGFDGRLHRGVLLAALEETLALAGGGGKHLDAQMYRSAPLGTFVRTEAGPAEGGWQARAFEADGELLALARLS
jgi:acyl-coenzyme A thioesterase PaaI-like protein